MVFPRVRAVVFGILFLGWLGFLAYLVSITRHTIVVAEPHLLTANLVVLADVQDEAGRPLGVVQVTDVLAAAKPEWQKLHGPLDLDDLPFCGPAQGWEGAGSYLIPISRHELPKQVDHVALLPPVPGYVPRFVEATLDVGPFPERVAAHLSDATGVSAKRLGEMIVGSTFEIYNVPDTWFDDKATLEKQLKSVGAKLTARGGGESRIYRATPMVREQAEAILKKR